VNRRILVLAGLVLGALAVSVSSQVAPDEDPVSISPQLYTVKLENEQVRILEYRLQPGETEPMHAHPRGVVYYMSDATFVITLPDGSSSEHSVTSGEVEWREFTRHAGRNSGSTEAVALAIEIKD